MWNSAQKTRAHGDGDCEFSDQWRKNEVKLLAFCRKRTRREQDAQEVFAETGEKAWSNYGGFRRRCSFFTWLARIALRAIADLGERQGKRGEREAPEQREQERVPARLETRGQSQGDAAACAAVIRQAVEADHLASSEATVLLATFSQPRRSWSEIGKSLQMTAAHGRDVYRRAKTKLAVYLVVHCADRLGGTPGIADAFESAKADKKHPMTPKEIAAFEQIVVARGIGHHNWGWQDPLRSACAKVCVKIGPANFTPPPPRLTRSAP
ncbi:MAG: sigma-70 family RNA polymerase sigma factor [Thermoguttaceae bacterium]